jgi:hypothetical protein
MPFKGWGVLELGAPSSGGKLSTPRHVVEAMGREIEIYAVIRDKRVPLHAGQALQKGRGVIG